MLVLSPPIATICFFYTELESREDSEAASTTCTYSHRNDPTGLKPPYSVAKVFFHTLSPPTPANQEAASGCKKKKKKKNLDSSRTRFVIASVGGGGWVDGGICNFRSSYRRSAGLRLRRLDHIDPGKRGRESGRSC
ncbi:hypothetical protein FQA47_015348 [Oryzias melastigma]|uniref:Uncharacterized protein n=1 Tax=Oryzias melastigma TaxID=30732 RepID=A0A834F790_ORYME|nr:hypothetical protein FQA47_015348 [Oryzias melastigma]